MASRWRPGSSVHDEGQTRWRKSCRTKHTEMDIGKFPSGELRVYQSISQDVRGHVAMILSDRFYVHMGQRQRTKGRPKYRDVDVPHDVQEWLSGIMTSIQWVRCSPGNKCSRENSPAQVQREEEAQLGRWGSYRLFRQCDSLFERSCPSVCHDGRCVRSRLGIQGLPCKL